MQASHQKRDKQVVGSFAIQAKQKDSWSRPFKETTNSYKQGRKSQRAARNKTKQSNNKFSVLNEIRQKIWPM